MTRTEWAEFLAECDTRGFTHVVTYGGPVPLPEWTPYGLCGGVNDPDWKSATQQSLVFTWVSECEVTDAPKDSSPFAFGVWRFIDQDHEDQVTEQEQDYNRGLGV